MEVGNTVGTLEGSNILGPSGLRHINHWVKGLLELPFSGGKQCHCQPGFILIDGFVGTGDKAASGETIELGWKMLGVSGGNQRDQPEQ